MFSSSNKKMLLFGISTTFFAASLLIGITDAGHFGRVRELPQSYQALCERLYFDFFDWVTFTSVSWVNRSSLMITENMHWYASTTRSRPKPYHKNYRPIHITYERKYWYNFGYMMHTYWDKRVPNDEKYMRHYMFYIDQVTDVSSRTCLYPNDDYCTGKLEVNLATGSYMAIVSNKYIRFLYLRSINTAVHEYEKYNLVNHTFLPLRDGSRMLPTSVDFITANNFNWNNPLGFIMATKEVFLNGSYLHDQYLLFPLDFVDPSFLGSYPQLDVDIIHTNDYYLMEVTEKPDEIRILHGTHYLNHMRGNHTDYDRQRFFKPYDKNCLRHPNNCKKIEQPVSFILDNDLVMFDTNYYCVFIVQNITSIIRYRSLLDRSQTNVTLKRINIPWETYFDSCKTWYPHSNTNRYTDYQYYFYYSHSRCDMTIETDYVH